MNLPEYNTELVNNIVSNLANIVPRTNESFISTYDYIYDGSTDYNMNSTTGSDSQPLEIILQQLFSKMSDNQTIFNVPSSSSVVLSSLGNKPSSSLSLVSTLPSSSTNVNSYRFLAIISLWFVLIINPIVILFGVIGNLFAVYILMNSNIIKFPVSFYTIMLNISDTLNLLIPVFIFWLDNCFNRTPESGYFRDKSNFLCKALMCPDQLFAALSAWYMCAISFNRWSSVCRPSTYFSRQSAQTLRTSPVTMGENNAGQRKQSAVSVMLSSGSGTTVSTCSPFDCACCFTSRIKSRQNLRAFRSIGVITLLGILCCLYPIFMHELRPVISTTEHFFDLTQKVTHTYAVIWTRCYYNRKHEYAYDIIGIILSCLLHILPLTFVAGMNIMIIVRLRQRRLMSIGTNQTQSNVLIKKKRVRFSFLQKHFTYKFNSSPLHKTSKLNHPIKYSSQTKTTTTTTTHKDQSTSTDLPIPRPKTLPSQIIIKYSSNQPPKRHHARDRTITIMLVSVALAYLILTLPYRLFWSYNVYIKRMYPEKLNSSAYLLKMHYIDHVLRTIRNIHYGTNFVFFIFLSKTFRRKFQQLFNGKFSKKIFNESLKKSTKIKTKNHFDEYPSILEEIDENQENSMINNQNEYTKNQIFRETSSLLDDTHIQEEQLHSIVEFEHNDKFQTL